MTRIGPNARIALICIFIAGLTGGMAGGYADPLDAPLALRATFIVSLIVGVVFTFIGLDAGEDF